MKKYKRETICNRNNSALMHFFHHLTIPKVIVICFSRIWRFGVNVSRFRLKYKYERLEIFHIKFSVAAVTEFKDFYFI